MLHLQPLPDGSPSAEEAYPGKSCCPSLLQDSMFTYYTQYTQIVDYQMRFSLKLHIKLDFIDIIILFFYYTCRLIAGKVPPFYFSANNL